MDQKNHPPKKKLGVPSPPVEALAKEVEEKIPLWLQDVHPLLEKLGSFSPEEREDFFLCLIKKGSTQASAILEALCCQKERLDLALAKSLSHWASPQAGILLHRLGVSTTSKEVVKSVRKSIFRLRSKGLPIEELTEPSSAVYLPVRPKPSEGFLSSIESGGARLVFLARPQIPKGMVAFSALIRDTEGIVEFHGFETSRKDFREYVAAFPREYPWEIVEADPEYCLGVIIEASEITPKKERALSPEFLEWRPLMGSAPLLPLRPLIYHYLKEEEMKSRPDLLERSASLFQVLPFQAWFLKEEEFRKYLHLYEEAADSRLVLTPYQKESRLMDIHRQAAREIFDEKRRLLYRRRLEEMAYVLWKKGQENEARISLAAAVGLEEESGILSPHPFLLELVKRSLTVHMAREEKKKEEEPRLIIKP